MILQDLLALQQITPTLRHAVVVGGGLIGIELAEMLHSRNILCPCWYAEAATETSFQTEAAIIARAIQRAGIDCAGNGLAAIHDDGTGAAGSVTTSHGERIACQFVD